MLLRGNGTPMFLLANVVDDIEMGITHVVRGEEHLPNTPKQQLLWEALGHEPPVWAHVPVLVNEERKKLSKRRDKVALEQYRDEGYLAEAMVNYLMTLGWAPKGDTEIVPWSEIEDEFRLEDVTHSPAFFDLKKLAAFNGEYIRAMPVDEFVARVRAVAPRALRPDRVRGASRPLLQTRVVTLAEAPPHGRLPVRRRADDRRGVVGQGDEPAVGRRRCSTSVIAAFETSQWEPTALKAEWRRSPRRSASSRQGPGAGARRGHRADPSARRCSSRSSVLGRDETLRRLRAARERVPG